MRIRRLAAALLAFALTSVLALAVGAQFAPGWEPGVDQPDLAPDPLPPPSDCPHTAGVAAPLPGTGADIASWLVSPARENGENGEPNGAPAVAAVLIPGAGSATRDRLLPAARALAACGVPSVTYDKPDGILFRDFDAWGRTAEQVIAETRKATGAERVAVVAWSEGGWVAARLAREADLIVTLGAPVVTPNEQVAWLADARLSGTPNALRRIPAAVLSRPYGPAWTRDDIRPLLAQAEIPILGVWGSADDVVPVTTAVHRLREAAPHASVIILAGADHALGGDRPPGPDHEPWAPRVASWLFDPEPGLRQGVEPEARRSLPVLPRAVLATHPALHLTLAAAAGVVAGVLVGNRTSRSTP